MGKPVEVISTNRFGNAIVRNEAGQYFRIIPEEWQCKLLLISHPVSGSKRLGFRP